MFLNKEFQVSFQNDWKSRKASWKNMHWLLIMTDTGDWLTTHDGDAPNLGYDVALHLWILNFAVHVYVSEQEKKEVDE